MKILDSVGLLKTLLANFRKRVMLPCSSPWKALSSQASCGIHNPYLYKFSHRSLWFWLKTLSQWHVWHHFASTQHRPANWNLHLANVNSPAAEAGWGSLVRLVPVVPTKLRHNCDDSSQKCGWKIQAHFRIQQSMPLSTLAVKKAAYFHS